MKFFKQLTLLALLAVLAFASCQKEEITSPPEIEIPNIDPTDDHVNGLIDRSFGGDDGIVLGCISIDYPFEMSLLDGNTIEITSEDDFLNALDDVANPPIDFVYPLNVTNEEEETFTANDAEELGELFTDCIPDMGWDDDFEEWFFPAWDISYENSCYELAYPLTLLDQDSMAVTANDEDELISLLSDGNLYSFAFPLNLIDEDGNTVTADDAGDLFDLLSECSPNPGPGGCGVGTFGCYELGYPATLVLIDGSTVVVNDDDEFAEVVVSGEWAGFEFPLTLIDEDGNEITVNNEEELDEALFDCADFGGGPDFEFGDFFCYDFVYPFSVQDLITGTTITFNDANEWEDYQFGSPAGPNPYEFVFPVTLVNVETDEEIVINDNEDIEDALSECVGIDIGPELGEFLCYDFVYPFSVENFITGTTTTINDAQEWYNFEFGNPNGPEPFWFVFPLSLTHVETGDEVTVDDDEELAEALEECW